MTPTAPTPLSALLSDPTIAAMLTLPHLATLAAKARAGERDAVAAITMLRATGGAATSGTLTTTTGNAPIVEASWTPLTPSVDPTYTMPPRMQSDLLASMATNTERDGHAASILIGAAGTGKTEAIRYIAAITSRPMIKIDASCIRDASEWFGTQTLVGNRVGWQDSQFVSALSTAGCIILIDEVNRASQSAMNALLSLCDAFGSSCFPQRSAAVEIASGVHIFCAANIGAEHSGTGQITPALRDRFRSIPCEYLGAAAEAALLRTRYPALSTSLASALVSIAATTRTPEWIEGIGGTPVSTRGLLRAAMYATHSQAASPSDALGALIAAQPMESMGGGLSPSRQLAAIIARDHRAVTA